MAIYLDNAATTAVCPEGARAAMEVMTQTFGNPSSGHQIGAESAKRLMQDRAQVADALQCHIGSLFFTSCGTEANVWAIRGAVHFNRRVGKHIITSTIEHSSVLGTIKDLEAQGYEVTWIAPDGDGIISSEKVAEALRPDTALVSLMLVNNEIGTVQPVAQVADAIRAGGYAALLHTDAIQGFLKVPCTPKLLGADLISISGHKVNAPKGVGVLYIDARLHRNWNPLFPGGGQERGLRSGTEGTAQIAALAAACTTWTDETVRQLHQVREFAKTHLQEQLPQLRLVGGGTAPHILSITLPGYPGEMLVRALSDRGICVSSGSACHKGKPSHVLLPLKLSKEERMGVLRISFGPATTQAEIETLARELKEITAQRMAVR